MLRMNANAAVSCAIVAVATLAACTKQPSSLAGTAWQAVSIEAQATHRIVRSTIKFVADGTGGNRSGSRIVGRSGCDSYGGTYVQDGSKLTVDIKFGKRRGCVTELGTAQERRFLAAIAKVRTFKLEDEKLLLLGAGGKTLVQMITPTAAN